jgi:hypothetical protein
MTWSGGASACPVVARGRMGVARSREICGGGSESDGRKNKGEWGQP